MYMSAGYPMCYCYSFTTYFTLPDGDFNSGEDEVQRLKGIITKTSGHQGRVLQYWVTDDYIGNWRNQILNLLGIYILLHILQN